MIYADRSAVTRLGDDFGHMTNVIGIDIQYKIEDGKVILYKKMKKEAKVNQSTEAK